MTSAGKNPHCIIILRRTHRAEKHKKREETEDMWHAQAIHAQDKEKSSLVLLLRLLKTLLTVVVSRKKRRLSMFKTKKRWRNNNKKRPQQQVKDVCRILPPEYAGGGGGVHNVYIFSLSSLFSFPSSIVRLDIYIILYISFLPLFFYLFLFFYFSDDITAH